MVSAYATGSLGSKLVSTGRQRSNTKFSHQVVGAYHELGKSSEQHTLLSLLDSVSSSIKTRVRQVQAKNFTSTLARSRYGSYEIDPTLTPGCYLAALMTFQSLWNLYIPTRQHPGQALARTKTILPHGRCTFAVLRQPCLIHKSTYFVQFTYY